MKEKKFGWKDWIAVVLAAVLLFGCVAGTILLSLTPESSVRDQTVQEEGQQTPGEESGEEAAVAEINDNVKVLTAEQAKQINGSIREVKSTNQGLYLEVADGTALSEIGIGDIFFLNGSKETPLGEPYFGKVVSVSDRGATDVFCVEAPKIDEVFDRLAINQSETLKKENISEIKTIEGVTVSTDANLDEHFGPDGEGGTLSAVRPQGYAGTLDTGIDQAEGQEFLFEFNVDILKAFGLKKEDERDPDRTYYTLQEAERITVYVSDTGTRYHTDDCRYVKRSKNEMTLGEAKRQDYVACTRCACPMLQSDDGVAETNASVVLEGKFGVEDLTYHVNYDWDVLSGDGLKNLSLDATGKVVGNASLRAFAELEVGGRTTTITLPGNCLKLEGLKEKMFPFAFIGYNGSVTVAVGNEAIRAQTSAVPLTVAFILYADLSGKIEVGAEFFFDYSRKIEYHQTFVKDYEWVFEEGTLKPEDAEIEYGFKAEVSGDADLHVGASIGLYVFNLNVLDLALIKVGVEAEGSVSLAVTNKSLGGEEPILDYDYYVCGYLKLLELRVNIKVQFDIWVTEGSFNYQDSFLLFRHPLFQFGKKNLSRYDSSTMSYGKLTAKDPDAIYYKDTKGKLIREDEDGQKVLYDEEFFSICGIDETFLYLCVKNETRNLDVYRVKKDGSGEPRRVLENVDICFANDEQYLYFRASFDDTVVQRLDRKELKISDFLDLEQKVRYLANSGETFYVVEGNDGFLDFLFGGPTCYYYVVDRNGAILENYGSEPTVSQYEMWEFDTYFSARHMIAAGHLYDSVRDLYWVSKDKSSQVLVECISGTGFKQSEEGIFTVQENDTQQPGSCKIVLYRAEDGVPVFVTTAEHNRAFFTFCQSETGAWYFFDQDSDSLTLYTMDENFEHKTAVKTFLNEEFPCNMNDCSMTMMDNRLYFYTMADNLESAVIYRYDLA